MKRGFKIGFRPFLEIRRWQNSKNFHGTTPSPERISMSPESESWLRCRRRSDKKRFAKKGRPGEPNKRR